MLQDSLTSLELKNLFNSVNIRNKIIDFCIEPDWGIDGFRELIAEQFFKDGRERWRLNEYDTIAVQYYSNVQDIFLLKRFDNLFNIFFKQDGMYIFAREENAEEYATICRTVHPYFFIATEFARRIISGNLLIANAESLSENITETALKHEHKKNLQKIIAIMEEQITIILRYWQC